MPLLGTVEYMQEQFIFMETSFTKGSRQLLLVSEQDLTVEEETLERRTTMYYRGGGVLSEDYLIGILDPVRKRQYGSIQLLNIIYESINSVIRASKLSGNFKHELGIDIYIDGKSEVRVSGNNYVKLEINTDRIVLSASTVQKLNVKPRVLGGKLTDIDAGRKTKYNTSTFLDASLESLQREGFDTSWIEEKDYIEIHSHEDWDNKLIPEFIKEFKRWKQEKDFEYFLVSIDFESDGLNAFCDLHPDRHKAVYFSISFKDHQSFGVFIDMENFDNADRDEIAKRLTYMTQMDVIEDRDLVFEHEGERLEIKRSELTICAHNMMIDRRFGMTMGADVWFNLCTLQLSFNFDPFMTRGINGLKHIVNKFFGIEYAELGDICGKKNKGMFKYLTDKRVIMMYGCADTDWHRLAAKKLIEIAKESKDYYGVDHVEQHMKLDILYMNHKADCDYQGMRVDYAGFKKEYDEKTRILKLYYSFMSQYTGRVKAYKDYEKLVLNAERFGVQLEAISGKDIAKAPAYRVDKWTGKELLDVLFKVLDYPIIAWTTQNKKAKLEGKPFVPKPAINTDALKYYLQNQSNLKQSRIDKAYEKQESLEDLKLFSSYLKEDFIDPVTGNVLISKDKFNSYLFPMMHVLLIISPLIKSITSELKPVVESHSEYKFAHCNTTSAVTRRDLNPVQTVSGKSKYKYLPYTDDYNYCAVDQAAVEIRILYGLSKDEQLILPLNNPEKDSHTETAALMHQKPAYTITKDVRKGIKFLAFGRPYGKEVYSSCKDFYGDTSPEHMAEMAYLFQLYDDKLSSVMKVLNEVRDKMDEPVNPPQSLKDYLEFDPDKNYGRMINDFGYCQHLEIRPDQEWFRQALRRKAGNFIIQGFAANLLRMIYIRLLKALWKKGWIQNRKVRIHLTVHDEIDMSYHKSLNPVELMSILYEALTVKMKGFPTFFVGINFGDSWGEAKADESELPVLLVKELNEKFKRGEFNNTEFENHKMFFQTQRTDYYRRRIIKELRTINSDKNIWNIDELNDKFTNYTVRSLLPVMVDKPLVNIPKGSEDPVLFLIGHLPKFIAQYMLESDDRKHYLTMGKSVVQITPTMLEQTYETIEDLFNNNPVVEDIVIESDTEVEVELDEMDIDLDMLDDDGFDFGEVELDADEYETDGIVDLNTGFLNRYVAYNNQEKEFKFYGSVAERVKAEDEIARAKLPTYNNFKVRNNKVTIAVPSVKHFVELRKFCVGKTTSNIDSVHLFVKHGGSLVDFKCYKNEFLGELDNFLSESITVNS